jgi:hypothetical protein
LHRKERAGQPALFFSAGLNRLASGRRAHFDIRLSFQLFPDHRFAREAGNARIWPTGSANYLRNLWSRTGLWANILAGDR